MWAGAAKFPPFPFEVEEGAAMSKKVMLGAVVTALAAGLSVYAQQGPFNDLPNPTQTVENYFQLGRPWGSTSAVDIDRDGRSIWVGERCGANTCYDSATGKMSPLHSILKFDASGKLERSFGAGMVVFAHGIHVDSAGNVWITDANGNQGVAGRAGQPPPAKPEKPVGHQ